MIGPGGNVMKMVHRLSGVGGESGEGLKSQIFITVIICLIVGCGRSLPYLVTS